MGLQGDVKAFSLDDLLDLLSASGHHGSLTVVNQDASKTLYLHQGGLYLERSTFSFRLGDVLVRRGEITVAQLEEALKLQREVQNARLGAVLVRLGYTTQDKIMGARRYQVEEEVYEIFGWPAAYYEFTPNELPEGFAERIQDPEEFRFEVRSVLMESARRKDEWRRIRALLPSAKRLYTLIPGESQREQAVKALAACHGQQLDPEDLFAGRVPLNEFSRRLGLSTFEAQALVAGLLHDGVIAALKPAELQRQFQRALREDAPHALRLYECALESPEFEGKGKFLDRVFWGSPALKDAAAQGKLNFAATVKGKRAFELLLGLFRQGITCEFSAHEEGQRVDLGLSKMSLTLRLEDRPAPDVERHLLAAKPLPASDVERAKELLQKTGRSLQQILVGGGYVSMDDWLRAQKDALMERVFETFLLKLPYVEVRTASLEPEGDAVELPLLPWLHAEVMREVRQWETMLTRIPSVRTFLRLSPSGRGAAAGDEVLSEFDGKRSLLEVIQLQEQPAQTFFEKVHAAIEAGHLVQLEQEEYRALLNTALDAKKRGRAIEVCMAAIECAVDSYYFHERLNQLEAQEAEISDQAARPTLRGELASFSLAEVLQSFNLSKRSGTLRVEDPEVEGRNRAIYLEGGEVYLLTGDKDLGEGDLLEEELVAAGAVTEDQLAKEAAGQLKDEIYEIFLWEGAVFEFAADYLPPEFYASSRHRKLRLNTGEFLIQAIRRAGEFEEARRVLPSDDLVLSFESNTAKMRTISEIGQEELLLLVDGRHTIADLVRIAGVRRYRALTVLASLARDGAVRTVDPDARLHADEHAILSEDVPTSGVIEEGFVGQLQFVATVQDMASAKLTGVLRVTDGRRSKELALVDGVPHRTGPMTASNGANGADIQLISRVTAQEVSECFSWSGTRFELLAGTLPPRLRDDEQREALRLDLDLFFDVFAEAGERWSVVGELVPRDQCVAYVEGDGVRERAEKQAGDSRLFGLVDGTHTPEDIARLYGDRYRAMAWLVGLFEEGLVVAAEPPQADEGEEEWDFSL
ncbi:MAG: DUF4388 domain-containing protein [Planctomycetes bacterium]|nr:DUF4388 domain-containing protein [Planctomycetota bacterium]